MLSFHGTGFTYMLEMEPRNAIMKLVRNPIRINPVSHTTALALTKQAAIQRHWLRLVRHRAHPALVLYCRLLLTLRHQLLLAIRLGALPGAHGAIGVHLLLQPRIVVLDRLGGRVADSVASAAVGHHQLGHFGVFMLLMALGFRILQLLLFQPVFDLLFALDASLLLVA